jgi:hypothetical protein
MIKRIHMSCATRFSALQSAKLLRFSIPPVATAGKNG